MASRNPKKGAAKTEAPKATEPPAVAGKIEPKADAVPPEAPDTSADAPKEAETPASVPPEAESVPEAPGPKDDAPATPPAGKVDDTPKTETTNFNPADKTTADTPHFDVSDNDGVKSQSQQPQTNQPMIDAALNNSAPSVPQHAPAEDLVLKTFEVFTQGQSLGKVKNVTDESAAIAEMCRAKNLVASKHNFHVVPSR